MYIHINENIHTRMSIGIDVEMYVYVCTYKQTNDDNYGQYVYINMCIHICIYMYVCIQVYAHVGMHVSLYVYMFTHIYIYLYTHICLCRNKDIHTQIYTEEKSDSSTRILIWAPVLPLLFAGSFAS